MVAVWALAAAFLYGTSDFVGGVASRRASALSFLTISTPAGAVIMTAAAMVAGGTASAASLGWGFLAGAAGGMGIIVFFIGLAAGPMSVVAPLSALTAAVLPVGVAIADGERLGPTVLAGALLCLAATVLVSLDKGHAASPGHRLRSVSCGIAAGAAFGLFFLFIRNAAATGGLWPLAASRAAGTAIVLVAAAWVSRRPVRLSGGTPFLAEALAAGAGDAAANLLYLLAIRSGSFALAVIITSLYPAVTVLLARLVLREQMRAVQRAGLAIGALGLILVTA